MKVLFEREEVKEDGVYAAGHTVNYIEVTAKGEGLVNRIEECTLTGLLPGGRVKGTVCV